MNLATYILVRLVQSFQSIESRDTSDWVEDIHLACTGQKRGEGRDESGLSPAIGNPIGTFYEDGAGTEIAGRDVDVHAFLFLLCLFVNS